MDSEQLMILVSKYVNQLLEDGLTQQFHFHQTFHTNYVVAATKEIGLQSELTAKELELVTIAAWFHDTGYTLTYQDHELASITLAKQFLTQCNVPVNELAIVEACILATQFPQKPNNLMEMVICDADFYHFSDINYLSFAKALKKEWEDKLKLSYTQEQWHNLNLKFLQNHHYFTPYGQNTLQFKKEKNIKELQVLRSAYR